MKRISVVPFVLLLSACGSPAQYQQECSMRYDEFAQVYACTKDKIYNDPRAVTARGTNSINPGDAAEIVAYGEELNSQIRQHLITDAQAKIMFAKRIADLQSKH